MDTLDIEVYGLPLLHRQFGSSSCVNDLRIVVHYDHDMISVPTGMLTPCQFRFQVALISVSKGQTHQIALLMDHEKREFEIFDPQRAIPDLCAKFVPVLKDILLGPANDYVIVDNFGEDSSPQERLIELVDNHMSSIANIDNTCQTIAPYYIQTRLLNPLKTRREVIDAFHSMSDDDLADKIVCFNKDIRGTHRPDLIHTGYTYYMGRIHGKEIMETDQESALAPMLDWIRHRFGTEPPFQSKEARLLESLFILISNLEAVDGLTLTLA